MGEVRFYLKKPNANKTSLIYLQMKYNGDNKLVYSFGQTIIPANWDKKKQRVKNKIETTCNGKYQLNNLLDALRDECQKAYNTEIKNGIPHPDILKTHLDSFYNRNFNQPDENNKELPPRDEKDKSGLFKLIESFIRGDIKYKGKDKSKDTLKTYKTTYHHLLEFEAKQRKAVKGYKIDFDTINLAFYYSFVDYLQKDKWRLSKKGKLIHVEGMKPNAVGKNITILKLFMIEAVDQELTANMQFKHKKFCASKEETYAVYLTEQDIMQLYHFDLSLNKRLEQVRDLFVFGCFTGFRFSDYNDVKGENLVTIDGDLYINQITKKTDYGVIIPANHIILDLFAKYKDNANRLPKSLSNQKLNSYIKEAAALAGLTETGRLSSDMAKPLNECISSHTARRSFATNLYLSGFPVIDIMKMTGHKTEKSFLNYIKVSKLDAAKRLSAHYKKLLEGKMKVI